MKCFVYTESGVIDMRHAQAAFETTRSLIDAGVPGIVAQGAATTAGVGVELMHFVSGSYGSYQNLTSQRQTSFGIDSAFSSEDLPSNAFGISGALNNNSFIDFVNEILTSREFQYHLLC